ncbi:MAG: DUF3391 domain-containing protein [bacterium]|nr:DUF3391 domain-containing protein [bacterium]
MAKKNISIDQLQVGMYMEADIQESVKGSSVKNLKLLGKGVLITSANQIRRIKEAGLANVTIDTTKGSDIDGGEVVPTLDTPKQRETKKKPLPPGRKVEYRESLKMAKKTKSAVTSALKDVMGNVAMGGTMDTAKLKVAGKLMTQAIFQNVDAMVGLTRIKEHDAYTAAHCVNVATLVLAVAFADGMDQSTCEMLASAALLHDIGKTKVPLEILNKPGRFEPHELAEMRKHTLYGEEILKKMGGISEEMMFIATQHHEMWDGSGYPHKMSGQQIHRFGQMTAVADVYDALTAARVYKPALPLILPSAVFMATATRNSRPILSICLLRASVCILWAVLLLNTEEVGIVYEPNPLNPKKPKVGIIRTRYGKERHVPVVMDLDDPTSSEQREIMQVLDPVKYKIDIEAFLKRIAS